MTGLVNPKGRGLLDQLGAKLHSWGSTKPNAEVFVLIDLDSRTLTEAQSDVAMIISRVAKMPKRFELFFAIEEIESWLLADSDAVKKAFPTVNTRLIKAYVPDSVVGAAEYLGRCLGYSGSISGADKHYWANEIAPHLDLVTSKSPSFSKFLTCKV
jgi:Domain of unknown function (DUF4276)